MAKFYKDSTNNFWVVDDYVLPAGTCALVQHSATDISIVSINGDMIYMGRVTATEVYLEDGTTQYASLAALLAAGKVFFGGS